MNEKEETAVFFSFFFFLLEQLVDCTLCIHIFVFSFVIYRHFFIKLDFICNLLPGFYGIIVPLLPCLYVYAEWAHGKKLKN